MCGGVAASVAGWRCSPVPGRATSPWVPQPLAQLCSRASPPWSSPWRCLRASRAAGFGCSLRWSPGCVPPWPALQLSPASCPCPPARPWGFAHPLLGVKPLGGEGLLWGHPGRDGAPCRSCCRAFAPLPFSQRFLLHVLQCALCPTAADPSGSQQHVEMKNSPESQHFPPLSPRGCWEPHCSCPQLCASGGIQIANQRQSLRTVMD